MRFSYDPAIIESFPEICGGVILARGLIGGPTQPALLAAYQAEQAAVLARLAETPLADLPSLAAWRTAFRRFNVNPTKVRSASEALLRRLTKKGDIPSINRLVDLANLVSIRYGLPVAVFDLRGMAGETVVRFARGDESFRELGSDAPVQPEPGEVIFVDPAGIVSARRWCWRQSAESAARADTTAALVTVEAQHPESRAEIAAAVADLRGLLVAYGGDDLVLASAILDKETPAFP